MKLEFVNPGFSYSLDSMMLFEESNQSDWWRDANFYFYPMLKKEEEPVSCLCRREERITKASWSRLVEKADGVCRKAIGGTRTGKSTGRDCCRRFPGFDRDLSGKVGENTGAWRWATFARGFGAAGVRCVLDEQQRGAMGISMHEITHFIWF